MLSLLLAVTICCFGQGADSQAPDAGTTSPDLANRQCGDAVFLSAAPESGGGPRPYLRGGAILTIPYEWQGLDFAWGQGLYAAGGMEWDVAAQVLGQTRVRGELQYMYRQADFDEFRFDVFGRTQRFDGQFSFHSVLFNGLVLFNATDSVSQYIGGGVGFSYGILEVEEDDDDGLAPELQVTAGFLVRLRENVALEFGAGYTYAFHEIEEASGGSDVAAVGIFSANLGVRVRL